MRREIMALRLACAAMPLRTVVETPSPARLGDHVPGPTLTYRPYASEEDTCAAVSNPEEAGSGYALQMGMTGAGLTLLALLFFTLIAGLLRALWMVRWPTSCSPASLRSSTADLVQRSTKTLASTCTRMLLRTGANGRKSLG